MILGFEISDHVLLKGHNTHYSGHMGQNCL